VQYKRFLVPTCLTCLPAGRRQAGKSGLEMTNKDCHSELPCLSASQRGILNQEAKVKGREFRMTIDNFMTPPRRVTTLKAGEISKNITGLGNDVS